MTKHLLSPDSKITIQSKEYVLDGSFKTLKKIQHVFGRDIIEVLINTRSMSFDEMAKLFVIGIGEGSPDSDVIEQEIVEEIGIEDARFIAGAWLAMAVTPKRDREIRAKALAIAAESQKKLQAEANKLALKK